MHLIVLSATVCSMTCVWSTEEELANFYTIAWFLVNVGTVELRKFFYQILGNVTLKNWLAEVYASDKRSLMSYQWVKLGATPTAGNFVDSTDSLDISLLAALIRVYYKVRPLIEKDQEISDITEDLKGLRNGLFAHVPHLAMSNDQFNVTHSRLKEIFQTMNVPDEQLNVPFTVYSTDQVRESTDKVRELEKHMPALMKRCDHVDQSIDDMLSRLFDVNESVDDFVEYMDSILAEILKNQHTHGQHLKASLAIQRDILAGQNEIKSEQKAIKAAVEGRPHPSKFGGQCKLNFSVEFFCIVSVRKLSVT